MDIAHPMVLPSDVTILPVSQLPDGVRRRLEAGDDDFAVSRPNSRIPNKILTASSAQLLIQFREPKRIIEAIIAFSRARESDPAQVLNDAFPLLADLLNDRLLVPAGSLDAAAITPSLNIGRRVGGARVLRCVQVLSDTELYQVRMPDHSLAALKIVRPGHGDEVGPILDREARALTHLGGRSTPRLIATGTRQGARYLLMEWRAGVPPEIAAAELRARATEGDRSGLLDLGVAIARAYAGLHSQGVVHGDVHPGNVLVDGEGGVSIVDFGLSHLSPDAGTDVPRGGVTFFFEPEYARALQRRLAPPPASERGEQYAVAALLFLLLTGRYYLPFSPHEPEAWRQIETEPPLVFSQSGTPPWPAVERLLARALSKEPDQRFPSLEEFAAALGRVRAEPVARPVRINGSLQHYLGQVLQEVGPEGSLLTAGFSFSPTASANLGAAGVAYGLYRLACIQEDPTLLSTADLWRARAAGDLDRPEAWCNPDQGITPRVIGRVSPYHCPAGVHWVDAAIARGRGDTYGQAVAIGDFVRASQRPTRNPDLVLGKSGTLLASAQLYAGIHDRSQLDASALVALGEKTLDHLLLHLKRHEPVAGRSRHANLGVAHGWAGVLYAIMGWCQSLNRAVPGTVEDWLKYLAGCAQFSGRGAFWPWVDGNSDQSPTLRRMPGWCNGSAGFVFLWLQADRLHGNTRYLDLAEKAGWDAWESPADAWDLCCGHTGRAFALLALYKYTGTRSWLERAHVLAARAVEQSQARSESPTAYRHSLFRGSMGLATLIADLERPLESCMPMFEAEGWDRG
jgi:eukaryotic-like serine/threonine-protein kinase